MILRWCVLLVLLSGVVARGGVLARFKMNAKIGPTIDVELYDVDRPITVSNFVAYIKAGLWHDNVVDRWEPDFVLQGGAFRLPHEPTLFSAVGASDNRIAIQPFGNIPFEGHLNRALSNTNGTLAMARVGNDTNSASLAWFFNLKDNAQLDTQAGGYTVFGRTIRGQSTLTRFTTAGRANIYRLSSSLPAPVYSEDGQNASWIHFDITVLTAEIRRAEGGGAEISWESVEGLQNIVELSTTLPPVWQEAHNVAGTGARMSVTNFPRSTPAYYRVRIAFPN